MEPNTAENAFLQSMLDAGTSAVDGSRSNSAPADGAIEHSPQPVQARQSLPRTIGGFLVDDDDEDEGVLAHPPTASVAKAPLPVALSNIDRGLSSTPQLPLIQSPVTLASPKSDASLHPVVQDHPVVALSQPSIGTAIDPSHLSYPTVPARATSATPKDSSAAMPPSNVPGSNNVVPVSSTSSIPVRKDSGAEPAAVAKARLPNDKIGILEDRIRDDPKGDVDAWLNLITEHRKRGKFPDARATYDRFFKIFPSAAEQWIAYVNMELENNEFDEVNKVLGRCLLQIPNLDLWSTYLNYIRRRNPLTTDFDGSKRKLLAETYEFVLQYIGIDKDSGQIWEDYVQFIRSGSGQIGGTNWQDQQKMDLLRKTYQRAICVPTSAVNTLWKDYDQFEMGLNKMTGRKFLQERSPAYVTARSSYTALQNLTKGLHRTTLPSLPPALGFDGDTEYTTQVELWKRWIAWEKDDPLELRGDDLPGYKARVLFVYKQALMALRFWPEMWCDAADFCSNNGMETEANEILTQGMSANPESCLLAFKKADRVETTSSNDEGDDSARRRGIAVREPYDKVLDALYGLIAQTKAREAQIVAKIKETSVNQAPPSPNGSRDERDDDVLETTEDPAEAMQKLQIETVQRGNAAQIKMLSRTISFVWIALMRAMRRIQGKGKPNDPIGGSRQIFTDARKRGRLTSDVYVASALIEYHCYKDPAATKIFERGMKLFPEDEAFALEYLKHLIAINDITNARAVFETTVSKLTSQPENVARSKPIYAFFHEYESHYGELSQVVRLEKRMNDLFPGDPQLALFSQRYSSLGFDPTAIRPIVSPSQARPKTLLPPPAAAPSVTDSPAPAPAQMAPLFDSPKRPLEESDNESIAPRKMARGESPLKGAAGRRLDAQKRTQLRNEVKGLPVPPPPSLAREILFLLSIIPNASKYDSVTLKPEAMVDLLRRVDLSRANDTRQGAPAPSAFVPGPSQAPMQYGYGAQGYGR